MTCPIWAPDSERNWGPIVIAFWKSAANRKRLAAQVKVDTAVPDLEAFTTALQLRDVDPVHTFTATAELRRQDPKYVQLWPSDVPHKRR